VTLTRTASGLQSLHRFLNVDIVVYCEGKALMVEDEEEGQDLVTYENTADVYYWSKVAANIGLVKRYHFKSIGSKSTLEKIANQAAANGITTITICVDADYEPLIGQTFNTVRTCRTYGYSWENDVLSDEVFLELIEDVIGIGPSQTLALNEIRAALGDLRPVLSKWTEIDISLKSLGKGCVFDRKRPTSCLDFQRHPELREAALVQRLAELGYSRGPRRVASVSAGDASRRCFGKLWAKNLYHYGMQILQRFDLQRPSYELFMRQAIAATFRRVSAIDSGAFLSFHRSQAAAFA
jgi:Protein of unknown function (DUF4435)